MRLRQANKIMRNVRKYNGMLWIYGSGRVNKANNRMRRYYAAKDETFKERQQLFVSNPLAYVKLIRSLRNATKKE